MKNKIDTIIKEYKKNKVTFKKKGMCYDYYRVLVGVLIDYPDISINECLRVAFDTYERDYRSEVDEELLIKTNELVLPSYISYKSKKSSFNILNK